MTDPIVRNETVWQEGFDHPHHDGAKDRHYSIPRTFRFGRWANGVLPYVISNTFTRQERINIARVSKTNIDLITRL